MNEDPSHPLLWDSIPAFRFDQEARKNLWLGVDGKGVYLSGLESGAVRASQRLDLPFPVVPAITAAEYAARRTELPDRHDGAAVPLLAGNTGPGEDRDPVLSVVADYWDARDLAESSVKYAASRARTTGEKENTLPSLIEKVKSDKNPSLRGGPTFLRKALPLVEFITKHPVFKGWDMKHNWLYGGGCVATMGQSRLAHFTGTGVAVSDLSFREGEPGCPPQVQPAQTAVSLGWPSDEAVFQVHVTDTRHEAVAVRGLHCARLYLPTGGGRMTDVDEVGSWNWVSTRPPPPLASVLCAPARASRWAVGDVAGRLRVRDSVKGKDLLSLSLPHFGSQQGWLGLTGGPGKHVIQAATWEQLCNVDVRSPSPVVVFRLSDNTRLFPLGDRCHAVRQSARRPHLTLLTTSRHLCVLDARYPAAPWLRTGLMVPQAPVYLDSAGCRAAPPAHELALVAAQTDHHVQAVAFDWAAGAEVGGSQLLGCAGGPLAAAAAPAAPGLEASRRLQLPLAGLAATSSHSEDAVHVYTASSCGDVFYCPLVPAAGRAGRAAEQEPPPGLLRRRRRRCRRLLHSWSDAVEQTHRRKAATEPLCCNWIRRFDGHLTDLLSAPPEDPPLPAPWAPPDEPGRDEVDEDEPVTPCRPAQTRPGPPSSPASSTDVSTPSETEIARLLSDWERGGSDSGEMEPLSVPEELQASVLTIPGSQRRRLVPRWRSRRRRRSDSGSSRTSSRSSSRARSVDRERAPGSAPAASLVTPARPVPQATPGPSFTPFSFDLF